MAGAAGDMTLDEAARGAQARLVARRAGVERCAVLRRAAPRLRSVEVAGDVSYMQTLPVGGPEHLPVPHEIS